MINKLIELLKQDNILYNIEYNRNTCLVILSTGTFNSFFQFEKSQDEDEWSVLSTWISNDTSENQIEVELYDSISPDMIEGILNDCLNSAKSFNILYSKLYNNFKEIEVLVNDNEILLPFVDELFNKLRIY
jgi:hypothetical protein